MLIPMLNRLDPVLLADMVLNEDLPDPQRAGAFRALTQRREEINAVYLDFDLQAQGKLVTAFSFGSVLLSRSPRGEPI